MLIGFIGVGAMGGGLARNLIRAGRQVLVYDLKPEAMQKVLEVGDSGKAVEDLSALADADVIFTSLPLPQHLEEVMLGESGLLALMKKGSTYIDVSTIDPQMARRLSDAVDIRDVQFLECPLGKTPAHAENRRSRFLQGAQKTCSRT